MQPTESAWRAALARRPGWMNALWFFCAYMTFVYVPWDLFWKPVDRDAEVWFGILFRGWAAKILTIPHWLVYAAGFVGFWRMKRWMWPWAALYAVQVGFGSVVWWLSAVGGLRGVAASVATAIGFGLLVRALLRARPLFQPGTAGLRDRYGDWALVTGASAGIGREFARALAREGLHVVLTARRLDRLTELSEELDTKYGVQTRLVPLDLAQPGGVEQLAQAVEDLEIGVLVNNAGFGSIGPLAAQDPKQVRAMVELNCVAPALLTRHLLPGMQARRRGAVIVVGSVAGLVPMPLHALYSATKAFDNFLGEALCEELRGSGVDVLALEPGSTETEFQQRAGERPHAGEAAESVVRKALEELGREPSLITGWTNWFRINVALRLLSRPVLLALVRRATKSRLPEA